MRAVTYNIRHGEFGLTNVAAALRDLAPDMVFLQEVDRACRRSGGVDQAGSLAQALGLHARFAAAFPFDGGEYGIALLTRRPLEAVRRVVLPHPNPRLDDGNGEPRVLLSGELDGTTYACTHLGLTGAERREQAIAIREALGGQPRVLLGGDLNEGPGGAVTGAWAGWLLDAFAEAGGDEAQSGPYDRPHRRIDFVLRSPAFSRPTRARVDDARASDHLPVVVEFEEP